MAIRPIAFPSLAAGLLVAAVLSSPARADVVQVRSETIVRFFEQERPDGDKRTGVPGYEYLQLDFGQLESDGLSAHFYGWGRYDFGDFYEDDSAGEALYGYLQYHLAAGNLTARLGRQYLFEGVSKTSVDGLRVGSDLTSFFTWSLYAGQPVALEISQGRSGDRIWGGRVAHRLGRYYNVGVSYKRVDDDGDKQEELLGVDASLSALGPLAFYGRSTRSQIDQQWQEHAYEARLTLGSFLLRPLYQWFDYDALFDTGTRTSKPFSEPLGGIPAFRDSHEKVAIAGAEASWQPVTQLELGAKAKHYDYKVRDDAAWYYSGTVLWHGKGLTEGGAELGRMDGGVSEDRYTLARAHFYVDVAPAFCSGEIVYAKYDEEVYGSVGDDKSIYASLGAGARFWKDAVKVTLQGEYSKDPNFDRDVRGLVALEYTFSK